MIVTINKNVLPKKLVAYGHVIKKVLKAIYFITKNDVAYDPPKAGGVK